MESTRAIGYSAKTAIADIIDNSISAQATEVDIRFRFDNNQYLYIADNGYGMTFDELKNAMRYGSRKPSETRLENDLGRYGLGMKTASLSQCRKVSVFTKKDGVFSGCCWDLDVVARTNDWTLLILDEGEISKISSIEDYMKDKSSCTVVLWENLDKLAGENTIDEVNSIMNDVASHLSLVYHRFISENTIVIRVNNRELEAIDPFLLKSTNGGAIARKPMDTVSYLDSKVQVTPYILPLIKELSSTDIEILGGEEGLRRNQGFYVYRNKRLLVYGTWFRLRRQTEKSKYARIQVDLSNAVDELWSLDIKKSQARPPEIIKEALRNIIDRVSNDSLRQTSFRGRRQAQQDGVEDVWIKEKTRDGVRYCINREHKLVELVTEDKKIELLLRLIEDRLPVDALYTDLMDDKKIDNNQSKEEQEVLKRFIEIVNAYCSSPEGKENIFDYIINSHMFVEHKEFLYSKREEILG